MSPPGVRSVATVSSSSPSADSTHEERTRCGAFGQPTENASVSTVSSADAATNALTYNGCAQDCVAARKRVPHRTADAPSSNARVTSPDVPMPPAATRGTDNVNEDNNSSSG